LLFQRVVKLYEIGYNMYIIYIGDIKMSANTLNVDTHSTNQFDGWFTEFSLKIYARITANLGQGRLFFCVNYINN